MKTAIAASMTILGAAALAACSALPQHEGGSGLPPSGDDQCMASEHQDLIGQNRSQIPQTPAGATWRVTCTSCAMTMDYRPDRLNILYDQETGIVREVKCG
ncbi:MAG: I78 family peptidase inhibitor [Brevundimonas sp.]